jgi:hypothetical protein
MSKTGRMSGRTVAVILSVGAFAMSALTAATDAGASTGATAARHASTSSHISAIPVRHGPFPRSIAAQDPLTYGNGPVMAKEETSYAIFWTPPTLQDGSPTYVSPTYMPLIEQYFGDVGGHGLYKNNTQYYKIVNGVTKYIKNRSTPGPVWVDTSAYPPSGCTDPATPNDCVSDLQVKQEVSRAIDANGWKADYTKMFFVFLSFGEGTCAGNGPSGCAFTDYCAWHGAYLHKARYTLYADMPYLGTTSGCHTPTSPNNDIAADSTINVASHEEMETVTDPLGTGWTSPQGEIGDKCVWFFGPLRFGNANEHWNGHYYVLQEEWSNNFGNCTQ